MLHRGKIATNPEILESRPLTREDLVLLREPRGPSPTRAGSGHVQRLREPHHRLARLIASGIRMDEVVARSGYSYQRIATIQKDPAFIELVAGYRDKITEAFVTELEPFIEIRTSNMITAERMIMEKLEIAEEEGTLPSIRELMLISADSADRLGYGKRNMNVNVNVDFARQMEEAIQRTKKVRTIEARPANPRPQSTVEQPSDPAVEAAPRRGLRRL